MDIQTRRYHNQYLVDEESHVDLQQDNLQRRQH